MTNKIYTGWASFWEHFFGTIMFVLFWLLNPVTLLFWFFIILALLEHGVLG